MQEELTYITASCSICKGVVRKSNEILFGNETGNLQDFLLSVYRHFKIDYPKFHKMDNLSKLGLLASEIVLQHSFTRENYQPDDIGLVFFNANASLDTDRTYWQSVKNIPSPALFVYTLPNIVIGEICIRNHFTGENAFFVQEKFDPEFMLFYVNNLMDSQRVRLTICGWVEILGDDYKTVVYLVEKENRRNAVPFTIDHINNIYDVANG